MDRCDAGSTLPARVSRVYARKHPMHRASADARSTSRSTAPMHVWRIQSLNVAAHCPATWRQQAVGVGPDAGLRFGRRWIATSAAWSWWSRAVPCQINRPGRCALTWAGLFDCQNDQGACCRPNRAVIIFEQPPCQLIWPDHSWPLAGPRPRVRAGTECARSRRGRVS